MTEPRAATFSEETGCLYWRQIWKSRADLERLAEAFRTGAYQDLDLADQCDAALKEYDAFHGEDDAA